MYSTEYAKGTGEFPAPVLAQTKSNKAPAATTTGTALVRNVATPFPVTTNVDAAIAPVVAPVYTVHLNVVAAAAEKVTVKLFKVPAFGTARIDKA